MNRYRHIPVAVTAIVLLNLLLTPQNIWPTPWVYPTAELSVEIAAIVILIAAVVEWRGEVPSAARSLLIAILLLFVIGRYAEITAPALFGRRIDLYWDVRHVPRIVEMVVESSPLWKLIGYAVLFAAIVGAIFFTVIRSVGALSNTFTHPGLRRGSAAIAAAVVLMYAASVNLGATGWFAFALPVTPVYLHQAALLAHAHSAEDFTGKPLPPSDLKRLQGGDAFLLFFESYGSGVFEDPRIRATLQPDFTAFEAFLGKSDWNAASAFVESPTFGGASWLAHTTTLSGRWITHESDYRRFLAKPSETLIDRFRSAGYRTVALLPGLKLEWPEGRALGYDTILTPRRLGYGGPPFGWWMIPDQYSLETLYQRELAPPDRKPVFVMFASIMSHMPFGPSPPYQADWSRMTTAEPFDPAELQAALALIPDWDDMTAGYLRTIRYDLRLLQGFLENRAPENAFIFALGDHQPPALVSGKDASWSVPVHVFSRDPSVIRRFVDAGFRPGIRPARPVLSRMDALNPLVLKALDSGPRHANR